MIQLTIMKITGYGPWTLTLGHDREHELQILQASLYGELQNLFSKKNSLVFLNRSDEFFAVTSGMGLADHIDIQKKLESKFEIKLAMSIGHAETPYDANLDAYNAKKSQIILDKNHNIFGTIGDTTDDKVTILHLDIDNLTSKRKSLSPYDISVIIFSLYSKMQKFFLERKSLAFFMGGDNFMVISNTTEKNSIRTFLQMVKNDGITINCGIGSARTAREAAGLATKSLDTIRKIRDSGKEKPEIYELSCF